MIFEEAMERCEGANAKDLEKIIQKNGWYVSHHILYTGLGKTIKINI